MRVRIKTKKTLFDKGDVATFSRDIYQIKEKQGQKNTLKNLSTGEEVRRTYTDEELDQTFDRPATGRSLPNEATQSRIRMQPPIQQHAHPLADVF